MQISDTTNLQGIFEEIDFYAQTDLTLYPATHKIRNLNNRYREILTHIFEVYGGWQFNDSNQTDDQLYADQTLTSGTSLYPLPTGAIIVTGAEVLLYNSSTYQKLYPYTQEEIGEAGAISEFNKNSGTPTSYQLIGDSIKVLPPPNYTQANSLRVWFWKDIVTFAVTDTAVVPGIPAIFHRALSIGGALDWVIAATDGKPKNEAKYNKLTSLWLNEISQIRKFYGSRFERLPRITTEDAKQFR